MKKILSLLLHPVPVTLVGLGMLALLVWWVGPLVSVGRHQPFASAAARGAVIGLLVLAVLVRWAWRAWRANRAHRALLEDLRGQARAPAAETPQAPGAEELQILRQRFDQAMRLLRSGGLAGAGGKPGWRAALSFARRRYLYDQPWYIFIGAPGSGKTTALVHSGLQFPLADRTGGAAVKGVGGTRNCDWWFTDAAVLIDTAGRYTTQDSDQGADQAAWLGFLRLLKKNRPRQPINGVLLTVSAQDLLLESAEARARHAQALRARLREVQEGLGTRSPVYVMVTKADLLAGFDAFFADLSRAGRAQVLGVTLPLDGGTAPGAGAIDGGLAGVQERLVARAFERVQAESDPARRSQILAFPQQFSLLCQALSGLVELLCAGTAAAQAPWIRGVYFTSSTQEGTPIDRVMGSLARSLGLERQVLAPAQASGRSYFITSLLREVVFAESGLAGTDARVARRRHAIALGAHALVLTLALGTLLAWGSSYLRNKSYVTDVDARAQEFAAAFAQDGLAPASTPAALLPVLSAVRGAAATPAVDVQAPPLGMRLGLWQGEKLDAAAQVAYRRLLADAWAPTLAARIEEQTRSVPAGNPEYAYEALKAYLMLHEPQHRDAAALRAWIEADWQRSLPRDVGQASREDMSRHLQALLAGDGLRARLPFDPGLVAALRAGLTRDSLAQRVYARLAREGVGENHPEFTVAKAGGPNAAVVFAHASGEPITRGVPGLYTRDAYRQAFVPAIDGVAARLAAEQSWVLDVVPAASAADSLALQRLQEDVRRLYLEDYARRWSAYLDSLRLVPARDLTHAAQIARVLSAPDSPLARLLQAAARETTLDERAEPASGVVERAGGRLRDARESLLRVLGEDDPTRMAPVVAGGTLESIVDSRFTALHALVAADGGTPPPFVQMLKLIDEAYVFLTASEAAVQTRTPVPASDVPNRLRAEAARMPAPVRMVLEDLGRAGAQETRQAVRANLSADLEGGLAAFCRKAIQGRYPFARNAGTEVTLEDFASLFGPGGQLDAFFLKHLASDVDTSAQPWAFKRTVDGEAVSPAGLAQFQRAANIRDVFFGSGAGPALRLQFRPIEMDPSILQFVLDIDGQIVRYAHGPQVASTVQWPGTRGGGRVSLQLTPPPSGGGALAFDGQWALFRMFDRIQIQPTRQPERFHAVFESEGRRAVFEITTGSVRNPFRLPDLGAFACPASL